MIAARREFYLGYAFLAELTYDATHKLVELAGVYHDIFEHDSCLIAYSAHEVGKPTLGDQLRSLESSAGTRLSIYLMPRYPKGGGKRFRRFRVNCTRLVELPVNLDNASEVVALDFVRLYYNISELDDLVLEELPGAIRQRVVERS